MRLTMTEIATISLFSALAYAGGYLLIAIPNIEIFTAIVFISGAVLGSRSGLLVGVIAQVLYSVFNPYGMSPLPLLLAQVLNRAIVGWAGGWFTSRTASLNWKVKHAALLGLTGLMLTWLYDVMAFMSYQWASGFSLQQMQASVAMGLPFYLVHGVGNAAIFALMVPVVLRAIGKTAVIKQVGVN